MAALVFALAVLMWVWGAAGLHLLRRSMPASEPVIQMVYLVLVLAFGAVPLLALVYLVLPSSVLSQGWTREYLESTQQASVVAVLLVSLVSFLRARSLLLPAAVKPDVAAKPVVKPVRRPAKK